MYRKRNRIHPEAQANSNPPQAPTNPLNHPILPPIARGNAKENTRSTNNTYEVSPDIHAAASEANQLDLPGVVAYEDQDIVAEAIPSETSANKQVQFAKKKEIKNIEYFNEQERKAYFNNLAKTLAQKIHGLGLENVALDFNSTLARNTDRVVNSHGYVLQGGTKISILNPDFLKKFVEECQKFKIKVCLFSNYNPKSLDSRVLQMVFERYGIKFDNIITCKIGEEATAIPLYTKMRPALLLSANHVEKRINYLDLQNIVLSLGQKIGLSNRRENHVAFGSHEISLLIVELDAKIAEKHQQKERDKSQKKKYGHNLPADASLQEKIEKILYQDAYDLDFFTLMLSSDFEAEFAKKEKAKAKALGELLMENVKNPDLAEAINKAKDQHGRTVAHIFAATGEIGLLQHFSKKAGLDLNQKTNYGNTALHEAVWHGQYDILSGMIQSGANPQATNFKGNILHNLVYNLVKIDVDSKAKGSEMNFPSLVKNLVEVDRKLMEQLSIHGTTLSVAVHKYSFYAFKVLYENGAKIKAGGWRGLNQVEEIAMLAVKASSEKPSDERNHKLLNLLQMMDLVVKDLNVAKSLEPSKLEQNYDNNQIINFFNSFIEELKLEGVSVEVRQVFQEVEENIKQKIKDFKGIIGDLPRPEKPIKGNKAETEPLLLGYEWDAFIEERVEKSQQNIETEKSQSDRAEIEGDSEEEVSFSSEDINDLFDHLSEGEFKLELEAGEVLSSTTAKSEEKKQSPGKAPQGLESASLTQHTYYTHK